MNIAFYRWNETDEAIKTRLLRRAQANIDEVEQIVAPIIADVKTRGDEALRDYARKFEGAEITNIRAEEADFKEAEKRLDPDLKAAIQKCAGNVRTFHEEQMRRVEKQWMVEVEPGVWAGEQVSPLESVGLYVPRGKGAFPSALYMLAIPAVIAGVNTIAVVTPPTPEGRIDDATLYTAKLCGIKNVFKAGGAQAIAALAYGTQTIPAVKKVLGPGSPYVAAAKRALSSIMDPGMPAGPSESIVLCDGSAHKDNAILDLLNEAEHGPDSAAIFITHDEALAQYVVENLPAAINDLPEPHRTICKSVFDPDKGYGAVILTDSLDESIELANMYAPEHLHLQVENPDPIIPRLKHAGEILIGAYTVCALGNYGIGINHVLPTGGWAHSYSCTSVWDFLKRTSLSRLERTGFETLAEPVTTLTDYEGFPAHGNAIRKREL